jgi:TRAP-type mannitol/chloroaromatic compound transport system substrate-binding protein
MRKCPICDKSDILDESRSCPNPDCLWEFEVWLGATEQDKERYHKRVEVSRRNYQAAQTIRQFDKQQAEKAEILKEQKKQRKKEKLRKTKEKQEYWNWWRQFKLKTKNMGRAIDQYFTFWRTIKLVAGIMIFGFLFLFLYINLIEDYKTLPGSLGKDVSFKWQPSSWLSSGTTWDTINIISKRVTQKSNGHLIMTPSSPGAIVPVAEQLSAVGEGVMKATFIWPGYFFREVPVAFMHGDCFAAPKTIGEMRYLYETYQDGKIMDILRKEYTKHGVHLVGNMYWILDNLMISKKPINGVADINGMKFRTSELIALQLADLGARTIWVPGDEIYTLLSTGSVDAITFSHASEMVAMGFHEVTKYWIKYPTALGPAADALIVNLKEWNRLPDKLKAIVETEVKAGTARNHYEGEREIGEAWKYVQKKGIKIIEWSEKDAKILASKVRDVVPGKYLRDPAFAEIFSIVDKWAVEMGYWFEK